MFFAPPAGSTAVPEETTLRFQHPLSDNPDYLKEMLDLSKQGEKGREGVVANPFAAKQCNSLWSPGSSSLTGSLSTPIG